MSEATLATCLQNVLLTLNIFSAGDVTINNWGVLDQSSAKAPYVIIEIADTFDLENLQNSSITENWSLLFTLVERFDDWDTSLTVLSADREAILAKLANTSSYGSSNDELALGIRSIHSDGEIRRIYSSNVSNPADALPVFIAQRVRLEVETIRSL